MSVKISRVSAGSRAAAHHIEQGDTLISINSHEIFDVLDYRFFIREKLITLETITKSGKKRKTGIIKREDDDIGLEFETYLMDRQHQCKNKCIFCFVDQMPEGMRDSLYFKDDDSRLSFLFGNYITLTGLSEREAQRITDMHLSPINISVHTTNPSLRVQMMKNPKAGESLSYLTKFAQAGISMNTQLVLCHSINDGDELRHSLNDLSQLYPAVQSIAAVPVGLTKYRDGLYPLQPYNKQTAAEVIDIVEAFSDEFYKKHGTRLAYAADEFYIKAEREMPDYDYYEDFPQLDNGVGMWRLTESEFYDALEKTEAKRINKTVSVATGEAAFPLIKQLCSSAEEKFAGLKVYVYEIKNEFFGDGVTVAGLITGTDLIKQLKGKKLGEALIIPEVMLRHGENVFLDDVTTQQLGAALSVKIKVQSAGGDNLASALIE